MKKDGSKASYVKSIQHEKEDIRQVEAGKEVAVSIPDLTAGRQINENEVLYSNLTENEFLELKKMKKLLKPQEIEILKEIAVIKRKDKPLWGI